MVLVFFFTPSAHPLIAMPRRRNHNNDVEQGQEGDFWIFSSPLFLPELIAMRSRRSEGIARPRGSTQQHDEHSATGMYPVLVGVEN
jgi:hypothetical protein